MADPKKPAKAKMTPIPTPRATPRASATARAKANPNAAFLRASGRKVQGPSYRPSKTSPSKGLSGIVAAKKMGSYRERGIDIPKFAGEVAGNVGKGLSEVGKVVGKSPIAPFLNSGGTVSRAMKNAPAARKALAPALGAKPKK